ncbi:MAG: GatB/YqeY domain-containing protein [Patescibacteria group bacterium]
MSLKEKIKNDLTGSLKQREVLKTSVLKMLLASVLNAEIDQKKKDKGLSDTEIERVIKTEAKKRQDAIEAYEKAGRTELAEKEKEELIILRTYLPEEMAEEEIEKIVKTSIEKTKAESMQDFGNVMKEAMAKIAGRADGQTVSSIVKKLLN